MQKTTKKNQIKQSSEWFWDAVKQILGPLSKSLTLSNVIAHSSDNDVKESHKIIDEGLTAGSSGRSRASNPHLKGTLAHRKWNEGYEIGILTDRYADKRR